MNNVTLVGRLTFKPELKTSKNNKSFTYFTVAAKNIYSKDTSFISCVAWNITAENMCKYLDKGSLISLIGSLNCWRSEKNNQITYNMEVLANNVTFLESKRGNPNPNTNSNFRQNDNYPAKDNYQSKDNKQVDSKNNKQYDQPKKIKPSDQSKKEFKLEGEDEVLWD